MATLSRSRTYNHRTRTAARRKVTDIGITDTLPQEQNPEDDLGYAPLRSVPKPIRKNTDLDEVLDRLIQITSKWEKILSLLALVTTNFTGNKSLGALLDIMAKDRSGTFSQGTPGTENKSTVSGMNLSELLSMAETILKNAQPAETAKTEDEPQVISTEPIVVDEKPAEGCDPATEVTVETSTADDQQHEENLTEPVDQVSDGTTE